MLLALFLVVDPSSEHMRVLSYDREMLECLGSNLQLSTNALRLKESLSDIGNFVQFLSIALFCRESIRYLAPANYVESLLC